MAKISWKFYMVFMALNFTMAIVVFFYPETARKSLEELDFLLSKDRTVWISRDRQAPKVGAIIDRDMAHGDAVADFEGKGTEAAHADYVENEAQTVVDNMLLISLDT